MRELLINRNALPEYRIPASAKPASRSLGETEAGEPVPFELQSGNAKDMTSGMLEYGLAVLRKFDRYTTEVLLYVGDGRAKMKTVLRGPHLEYWYRLVDVREQNSQFENSHGQRPTDK